MFWDAVQARQADPEWQKRAEERNELERFAVPGAESAHFNCRMFDPTTKRCTIYEKRPDTCRSFPFQAVIEGQVTNTCHHCGLTLTAPTP